MQFAASTVKQKLVFEQDRSDLFVTHLASYASRDLWGKIHGRHILVRSTLTEGARINFTFTGKVKQNSMEGRVSMGEYGMTDWKAEPRHYDSNG